MDPCPKNHYRSGLVLPQTYSEKRFLCGTRPSENPFEMKRTYSTTIQTPRAPKRSKRSSKSSVPRSISSFRRNTNGVPAKLKTTLKYATNLGINPSLGGCAGHTFAANGLYDPDITGTGHQPMGFDQIAQLYLRYTVTAVRMKVSHLQQSATTQVPGAFGIIFNDDASLTLGTPLSKCAEQRNVSKIAFGSNQIYSGSENVTMSQDIGQYFGHAGSLVGEGDYSARTNTNPARLCYLTLFYGQDVATAGQTEFLIQIEYDVTFTEPLELAQS